MLFTWLGSGSMVELYTLTALDAVRIVTPMLLIAIVGSIWTWFVIYITEIKVNRKWLRDPDNMERTVKDQLARKDTAIMEWQKENKELRAELEKCRAILRGVRNRVIGGVE